MSAIQQETERNPRVGMLAIVRKRRAVISEVRPFAGENGVVHLVRLDYKDEHRPEMEELIWELEPWRRLLEPNELPRASDPPMSNEDFDALVRAARWSAILPYLDPDAEGPLVRMPISSPFHGAVQVEDYQLVPLLKALTMPRINLMIADDVGLGKTIEAGLTLSELLIRRRIHRVLILTPASLRIQWRDEMWQKFSLPFDVIDRDSTQKLKRSLGIDANPWRTCSRAISSYYYLRQPDVLEQFRSACVTPEGSPHLPWDLLIVDEVHNLMPSPFGEDSDLCNMLRMITPYFEHRIFLTATPHNGHTRCFSGLLELLDPVRFTRTDELKPAEKERVKQVVVRRLKREINARSKPPRFCVRRPPLAILLRFAPGEKQLLAAFSQFRSKVRSVIASESKKRRLSGSFAIEILGKRLLSGPITFADSWRRCKLGLEDEEIAGDSDVMAAKKSVQEETADDRETEQRQSTASTVIGAWMKAFVDKLAPEIAAIDRAVGQLGIDMTSGRVAGQDPTEDARYMELCRLIERLLREKNSWKPDERLVVFTEYKTTLDYLLRRLRTTFAGQDERFLSLFGGMEDAQRERIKDHFNDPEADVRVLVATDAASEGLNLQATARYLMHFDCPWNPSRLEQRNGRLDRHGQARDVQVHHFASEEDSDIKFIAHLISKVDQIREDLGATGELFDEATHRCLIEGEDVNVVQRELDAQMESLRGKASFTADDRLCSDGEDTRAANLSALAEELDLDQTAQHATLDTAMSIHAGRPQLSPLDESQRCRVLHPSLGGWSDTIDETVRRTATGEVLGPLPSLAFSPDPFIEQVGGRPVFRPRLDTMMVHLAHPLMCKAINWLTRRRFPGPQAVSRWTVRCGDVPEGTDAVLLLQLEELAVNELRETFHHWIRTVQLPVTDGELGPPLRHLPPRRMRETAPCQDPQRREQARDLLSDVEPDLQDFVKNAAHELRERLREQLAVDGIQASKDEETRYRSRQGEVSALIAENSLAKLEREIAELKRERQQGRLFDNQSALEELDRSLETKKEELERRRMHYEEVREQLARERERILNRLIPKRFALQGEAQVFPVAIEVRFPHVKGGER
jgi:superfamily II DNA or RNA helicase